MSYEVQEGKVSTCTNNNNGDDIIVRCPLCTCHTVQVILDCKSGRCLSCDFDIYFGIKIIKRACDGTVVECGCVLPSGYCHHCCTKLVPVGHARSNGRSHNDWPTRKYHKKCWKELKDAGEFDNSDNSSETE